MANYAGSTPVEYARWIGLVDQSDPTNLPLGCAALCMNCRFTLTEVETRYGMQTAIQGKNQQPITGLMDCFFTPETALESYFQSILLFDYSGSLMIENPTGTGRTQGISNASLVSLPASSHMIGTQAYNRAWMAFSNLLTPTSYPSVYDLSSKTLYPYGMKPLGFGWASDLPVLAGECCTPSQLQSGVPVATSNGHLYICTQSGTTGAAQPTWPLTEGGTVADGTAIWKEQTPVMANRLPSVSAPKLIRVGGAGTLPAGDDVYIEISLVNSIGESLASLASVIVNTVLNDQIQVTIPALASLPGWVQGLASQYVPTRAEVYVAGVATGSGEPASSSFQQLSAGGPFGLGTTANVDAIPATGIFPPVSNTARVTGGQVPPPIVSPPLARSSGAGTFPAGRDVYFLQTYINAAGETTPGPANSITDTQLNDAVLVTITGLQGYATAGVRIYECDVPTGTLFGGSEYPPFDQFALVGTFQPGATATVTTTATGVAPPTTNTTGAAGNIAQDTPQGGPNSTQGYRYMALAFEDQFDSISGMVQAAVQSYDVDEGGWELGLFNLPTGPSYIKNVIASFSIADGTDAGPFGYNPLTTISAGISMTATIFPNGTSSAVVNFSDDFLTALLANADTNLTDRLRVIQPQQCVDIFYSRSTGRIFQSGVPGYYSGHWVSLSADPESYYGDTGLIQVGTNDGERAWCVREYQGTLFSFRERSGFELSPSTGDPSTWSVTERWNKVGPCGPRAVDVCGEFMVFVHISGIYLYGMGGTWPQIVSKEINRFWATVNWQAAQTIWVAIDVQEHEVRIGLPVGASTVPNVCLTLNYEEGWNNPLYFSRFSEKEITIEQARKYSVDNIAGFVGGRFYRTVSGQPQPIEGPVNQDEQFSRQYVTQFLIGSSGPDGTVQALTPGVYNDNGAGIDCQYEGIAVQQMMSLSKLNGISINARGYGSMYVSFIAGARKFTDWTPGNPQPSWYVPLRPLGLEVNPSKGLTRMAPSRLNERWRPRFTNGAIADAWFSLKYATVFVSPMFQARNVSEAPSSAAN